MKRPSKKILTILHYLFLVIDKWFEDTKGHKSVFFKRLCRIVTVSCSEPKLNGYMLYKN